MRRQRILVGLVLGLTLMLGACTPIPSGPTFSEFQSTVPPIPPDQGRIVIYRTVKGWAVQPTVKLNGEIIGSAVPYGFFFVDRPPGDYAVLTAVEADRWAMLGLRAGETQYVRLNLVPGIWVGQIVPELVHAEVGAQEVSKLTFVGGPPTPPQK